MQRLADAAAAVAVADVDRGLGDPGVDGPVWRRPWRRPSRRPAPSSSATQRWSGSQRGRGRGGRGPRSRRWRCRWRCPRRRCAAPPPSRRAARARTVTSAGRSLGQHGRGPSMPMTTSAACGRPVQQAALTDDEGGGASLRSSDEPDVGELADVVRAGGLADPELLGQLADGHRAARRPRRRAAAAPGSDRPGRRTTRRRSAASGCDSWHGRSSRGSTVQEQVHAHRHEYRRTIDGCVNRRRSIQSAAVRSTLIDGGRR